jgi:hypothetical protein
MDFFHPYTGCWRTKRRLLFSRGPRSEHWGGGAGIAESTGNAQ